MWYKLSDLFDLQMGKTPSRNNPNYWNSNDYLWVSISDMSGYDKYVSSTKEYISELAVKESGIKTIPANTVIMSFKLSIGKTAITTDSIFSNEAIMAFIDKKTTAIDPEYIFYLFSGKDWDEGSNKAVMGKTLNKVTLSNIEVDIPSLDIQKERVDKLNKISTLIANKKQHLNQLDELVKARFVEMFKDEDSVFAFDDVLIDDTKNGFKLDSSNYSNLGKIAIVDQGQKRICGYINAVDGKAPWSKEAIIFGDHTEMLKYINFPFYLGADGTKLLSPKNGWNTRFLYHYLDINYHKRLGYMRHFKYLKKMSFIKPDLDRQEEFCMFCTQVDKSKFTLQNSIISLMNLWYNINQYVCERTYGEA